MEKEKNVRGKIIFKEFEHKQQKKFCKNNAESLNLKNHDKNLQSGSGTESESEFCKRIPGIFPGGLEKQSTEMPTLRIRPSRVVPVLAPEGMTSASGASGSGSGKKTGGNPAGVSARLAPMGLMNNLPYMGELTFDTRPRRGRKPKKADICHLISKNYGIQFPNSYVNHPNSSLATSPTSAAAAAAASGVPKGERGENPPKRKSRKMTNARGTGVSSVLDPPPDANSFPWKFLPELIPSSGRFHPPQQQQQQQQQLSSQNNNNNRNKTIPQISISAACSDMGLIFPPSITLTPITRNLLDEPLNLCLRDSSRDSPFPRLGVGGSEVNNGGNIRDSNVARPPQQSSSRNNNTKPIRDSNLVNSQEQSTTTTTTKQQQQQTKKRSWEQQQQQQPPVPCSASKARERSTAAATAAAVAAANSAQVSICKFKFTGGAKPSLQEKKMLSVDSGGNFRFFTDKPASCSSNNHNNNNNSGGGAKGENYSGRNPRDELSLQFSSDSTTLPKSAKSMSMCMMPSIMAASAHAHASASAASPIATAESLSHDEDQPMELKEENPSLSPQHNNNSNWSCNDNESSESSCAANDHPPVAGEGKGTGGKFKVKRKRRTRKSLVREKLEKTFKEKGFLIQTQQLESAEGATYCKFRQLRKFTRYLFRSWKDYLPDTVKEIGGSGSPPGASTAAAPAAAAPATNPLPHGESSDQSDKGGSTSPSPTTAEELIVKSEQERDVR